MCNPGCLSWVLYLYYQSGEFIKRLIPLKYFFVYYTSACFDEQTLSVDKDEGGTETPGFSRRKTLRSHIIKPNSMKTLLRSLLFLTLALMAGHQLSAQYADIIFSTNYECAPMIVDFTNTSDTVGLQGNVYFDWYIEGHGNYSTFEPPTITFTEGGKYEVTLTMTDDSAFVNSYTTTMEAYDPGDAFYPDDGATLCPGVPITFWTTVAWYNTEWDFGDGSIHVIDDDYINHTYINEGTYTVTLIVDHLCGPDTIEQTLNIDSAAVPVVQATVEGNQIICPNELVTFNTNDNFTSYHWDFGDGDSSNLLNPSHFFPTQDSADYKVVLTVTNSCGITGTDTLDIFVRTYGEAEAYFHMETNEGANTACPNTPVKFVPHFSANAYHWDLGDGTTSNERSPVNYYSQTGWYYITLTVVNGCGNTATYMDSLEVYLYYEDTPFVDFWMDVEGLDWDMIEGDTIVICPGELVDFENNSCCGELRYEWDFGDGSPIATSKNAAHVFSTLGYHTIRLTAYAPCGGENYHEMWVWVDDSQIPDVNLQVVPELICPGEDVFFWDEGNYDLARFTYDIWFGDGDSLILLTSYTDPVLETLASHPYTGVANDSFNYVFNATNQCGNTFSKSGYIKITDDPAHKPFYYVENSTTSEVNKPMEDWSMQQDDTDHEFTIYVNWPDWPGYQDTFAVYFWYEGFDPYSGDDPGSADGFVTWESSTIQIGDTVKAYIPFSYVHAPIIGMAAGWTCSGMYYQGIEPEAWGMPLDSVLQPITSFPLTPGGFTDMTNVGFVTIDPTGMWDGVCTDQKPGEHYYYLHSGGVDYIQLSLEETGDYYLYASSDQNGYNWVTDISYGTYTYMGGNIIEFDNGMGCMATYSYVLFADSIIFTVDYDLCSNLGPFLTTQTFIRMLDFGTMEDDMSACVGDNVEFIIAGGSSYVWHFGDGQTSTDPNPMHIYDSTGSYVAFVIAMNTCGRTDTIYTPVEISDNNLPRATFWYYGYDFPRQEPVQFRWGYPDENGQGNLTFSWDFGDGTPGSTEMNPIHAFERDGEYVVTLTVTNGCGSSTYMEYIWIRDAVLSCEAKFADSLVSGTDSVFFEDISRGNITSWFWEFGDGSVSNEQHPLHVFPGDGIYYVCLSVFDSLTGCATQFCRELILGTLDCRANFVYSSNDALDAVQFTDQSTGATEWFWDFGDGTTPSDMQNPLHTYSEPGVYFVCLSIYNSGNDCYSEICQEVEVGTTDSLFCFADFSYIVGDDNTVKFTDESSNNISDWYWILGDGTSYEGRTPPLHTYPPGYYEVCLIVFDDNTGCTAQQCKRIPVGVSACNQDADFSFFIDLDADLVAFTDQSTGTITDYFWDFGDGVTSTEMDPKHTYTEPGFYLVTLSVFDDASEDCIDHTADFITIGTVDCRSLFEYQVSGQTVQFYEKATGNIAEYFWWFDDGDLSELEDPMHTYERPGLYHVGLTVVSSEGLCMDYYEEPVQVGNVNCAADFKYFVDSASNVAYFTPEAIGSISDYFWVFGDGSTSSEESPVHHFAEPGYYTVGLNTYDNVTDCMDYFEEVILIGHAGIDCRADFIYSLDPVTRIVKLKDQSHGDILEWVWNYGDGSVWATTNDTTQHQYPRGGQYMVCLTVVNTDGIPNTYCEWIQVVSDASDDCFADFFYDVDSTNLTVTFMDASFGDPNEFSWDYGDSTTLGITPDPVHIYQDPDFYLVTLKIANTSSECRSKHSEIINVGMSWLGLQAGFDYEVDTTDEKAESYPVDFVGVSLGDAGKLQWTVNGEVVDSTSMNLRFEFDSAGTYEVCFTITDPVTDSTSTFCDSITVGAATTGIDPYSSDAFHLGNYPNPFSDMTNIVYELPAESEVKLAVYDHMGRMVDLLVSGERQMAGEYRIEYYGSDLKSGIYILRLVIDRGVYTSKMVIQ